MSRPNTTWKGNETDIARFFGYIGRNSLSGDNSKSGSSADNHPLRHKDLPKGKLYIECKRRKGGSYLSNLYVKEKKKAKRERKILVLDFIAHRQHFLFIRREDLLAVAKERRQALDVDMTSVIKRRPKKRKKLNLFGG